MLKIIIRCIPLLYLFGISNSVFSQVADGPLVVSQNGHWFEYRDSSKPFFMAGSGGPEGFFYETDARKQTIVDDLISTGANSLYVHTIRSFQGDGYDFEDPFNTNEDINSGVDNAVLDNWLGYLSQLDNNKIVSWIHIIDDTARPWGCIDSASELSQAAKDYIATIVNKFKGLDHLVWLSGEEYLMGTCTKAQDDTLMSAIAAEIRLNDPVHPIGVHHNNGQDMQFGNDPNVNVFAQQICGSSSVRNPDGIHNSASFDSSWVYVMSECHPWHKDLIEQNGSTAAESRELLRLSNWATALAGGYVMIYDSYECSSKQCTRNSDGSERFASDGSSITRASDHDPSIPMLNDLTRLHQFMLSSDFHLTTPNDGLTTGDAIWAMGNTGIDTYIVYSNTSPSTMGVVNLPSNAVYTLRWFDPETGADLIQQATGSQAPFAVPTQFNSEVALSIKLESGGNGNRAPIANNDNYDLEPGNNLVINAVQGVLANDTDFENDPLTAQILSSTTNGGLTLNSNGSFSYQPNANFIGQDSFSYRANDGLENSNAATVIINVNSAPSVSLWLINATTNQRTRQLFNGDIINLNSIGFTSFSVEADANDTASIVMNYSGIANGSQTESTAPYAMFGDTGGNFSGMPVASGMLTIEANAFSGSGGSGELVAQSNISVTFSSTNPNRAPSAVGDEYFVLQSTLLSVPGNRGVLVNDSDLDGDPLTAELVSDTISGVLALDSDGGFTYQAAPDFLGTDTFTYRAKDNFLNSTNTAVTINVVDQMPSASDDLCVPIKARNGKVSVVCF